MPVDTWAIDDKRVLAIHAKGDDNGDGSPMVAVNGESHFDETRMHMRMIDTMWDIINMAAVKGVLREVG